MRLSPFRARVGLGLCAIALLATGGRSVAAAAGTAPSVAAPDAGFLEQYAATGRFRLGQPSSIRVTPGGDAVLFLRSGPRDFAQNLYSYDVATGRERVLLTAASLMAGHAEHLSAEERAHRERLRVTARGIVSYQLSDEGARMLVPLSGRLFVVERATGAARELHGAPGFPLDPLLSPDGRYVSCVRNGDLYVTDVATGAERRLTFGANDTISRGTAEFVAQEEMDRYDGTWWSPDGAALAYQETREGNVELLHILDPANPEEEPRAWRYPRPGMPNADVRLGIVPVAGGRTTWVRWDRERYPYLATVRWMAHAPLTILVQNRRQTEEALLAVDPRDGATRTLLVERDAAWLNLDQRRDEGSEQAMPVWLADGSGFLWTTERAGQKQLELRARDGSLRRTLTPASFPLRRVLDLDEAGDQVWVTGSEDPTTLELYRVPLDPRRGPPVAVTSAPGLFGAVFARNHRVMVRSFSDAEHLTRQTVCIPGGRDLGVLRSVVEAPAIRAHLTFETVGARALRTVIIRPDRMPEGARLPVIVSVYGGPGIQKVERSLRDYLLEQWIADHGFIVVSIDGRGTPGRGRSWERATKGNLIDLPLADQCDGLAALGAAHPEMDLSRVGIFGWSFGGYFSAMAVLRRPDVFRAGVAGAPVSDWRDYDTHYTERYMDLPERNRAGYDAASVLTYAPRLRRPLLIVHGTVDDNVYFVHSMKLCGALFRAGKPFEFLPLAGFTHMVPDPLVTRRLYGRIEGFLAANVAGAGEPGAAAQSNK